MMKLLLFTLVISSLYSCDFLPKPKKKKQEETSTQLSEKLVILKRTDPVSKLIAQNWILSDATPPLEKDLEVFGKTTHGQPALFIMNNGVLVENPLGDLLRPGRYILTQKEMRVKYEDGKSASFLIERVTPTQLWIRRKEDGKETALTYKASGIGYRNSLDNPYHPKYNWWRIKPIKPEDEAALKHRLRNYMDFYVIFFQDFLNRDLRTFSLGNIPCCFNWYKGGITIHSEKNLQDNWINCFYNREQALKARAILEDAVMKKHKWVPNVPNWVEQTEPVLRSIRDSI
jgi:hypothetical protein